MDRDSNSENLQERKNILVAEIMTAFRDLVNHGAAKVENSASMGQAAYSSMSLDIMMSQIIKSTEDLLTLTRKLRELWIVGPLKAPGADDAAAEEEMRQDAGQVFAMLNALRDGERRALMREVGAAPSAEGAGEGSVSGFTFERGEVDEVPPARGAQAAVVPATAPAGAVGVKVQGGGA